MKKSVLILLGIFLYLGFMGCESVAVRIDYDETVVFNDYDSFYFVRPQRQQGRGTVRNPLITREILREIRPILESKGFAEATTQKEADLLVVFYAAARNLYDF